MRRPLPLLVVLVLAACDTPTAGEIDENVCPQTSEFGNFGCAALAVFPGELPDGAPDAYRWTVTAEGKEGRFELIETGTDPVPRPVEGRVTLWRDLPEGSDTTTVPVVLEILDDTGPVEPGVPLPLFAVDTVRHTLRFAEVGERPRVDSLRFQLERVEAE